MLPNQSGQSLIEYAILLFPVGFTLGSCVITLLLAFVPPLFGAEGVNTVLVLVVGAAVTAVFAVASVYVWRRLIAS